MPPQHAKPWPLAVSFFKLSELLKLEKFDRESIPDLISWVDSEELLLQFAGPTFSYPLTNEQLNNSLTDKNRFPFKVTNEKTNLPIGYCEVYLTDHSAYLGRILIGDKEQRSKGYGQQIVKLLLNFVFSNFDITKAELNVFDWNIEAIKCYEKIGLVINVDKKIQRQFKNETWTAINMTIDKSKWETLPRMETTNAS